MNPFKTADLSKTALSFGRLFKTETEESKLHIVKNRFKRLKSTNDDNFWSLSAVNEYLIKEKNALKINSTCLCESLISALKCIYQSTDED